MTYTQRLNAFAPTKTWEVAPQGLIWSDDKGEIGEITWENIKSVRLRFEPSRAERRRIGLHIYTPIKHTITNIHYKGVMDFVAQKDTFRVFVMEFHKGFPKDTQTVFHKGSTRGAYIGNLLITLLIFAFLFLLAPLLALTGIPGAASIVRIGIILICVPVLLSALVKNKPNIYTPKILPLKMLR